MPFGTIGRTGPGMRQVVWFGDRSAGRGTFGGAFGARHCNQWGLYGVRICLLPIVDFVNEDYRINCVSVC